MLYAADVVPHQVKCCVLGHTKQPGCCKNPAPYWQSVQADTPLSSVVPIAGGTGARTSVSHHSLEKPYATQFAQAQHNARMAAHVSGGAVPRSDLELIMAQPTSPPHLHFEHQQAAQQSTDSIDAGALQLDESGQSITSYQKQSRGGGRGTPLGQSGKGRGRGRHRVTIQ